MDDMSVGYGESTGDVIKSDGGAGCRRERESE